MADKKVAARVVRGTGMSILLFFRTLELVSEKSQQRQKIILWYHVLFLSPMDPETYKLANCKIQVFNLKNIPIG